jgi:chemotaxis protein methyltransferase CheR
MAISKAKLGLSPSDLIRFTKLAHDRSGLEIPAWRRADLERTVLDALAKTGSDTVAGLFDLLTDPDQGKAALDLWLASLTVGETHFFRNRAQFDALANHVLPELIERRRSERRLRVWSAGCATGEEAYSVAILIRRILPDWSDWKLSIVATDIDHAALERARGGRYRRASFRGAPPDTLRPYVVEAGSGWEVVPEVRQQVAFRYLNLASDNYPSPQTNTKDVDLILCRNVLIYFSKEATRRVAGRFYDALADGGWLVVGHAEPSQDIFVRFATRNFPGTVLYQKQAGARSDGALRQEVTLPATAPQEAPSFEQRASDSLPALFVPRAPEHPERHLRSVPTGPARHADGAGDLAAGMDQQALLEKAIEVSETEGLRAAGRWLDAALELDPLLAPAHYLRGLILAEGDDLEGACDAFRRAVYADPALVVGHFALAGVAERLGEPDRARRALRNVERLLHDVPDDLPLDNGGGLTAGRLREVVALTMANEDGQRAAGGRR